MADSADDAQSLQERALADVLAHRQNRPEVPAPTSDTCSRCRGIIEPERRLALPKTNICGGCATELKREGR